MFKSVEEWRNVFDTISRSKLSYTSTRFSGTSSPQKSMDVGMSGTLVLCGRFPVKSLLAAESVGTAEPNKTIAATANAVAAAVAIFILFPISTLTPLAPAVGCLCRLSLCQ